MTRSWTFRKHMVNPYLSSCKCGHESWWYWISNGFAVLVRSWWVIPVLRNASGSISFVTNYGKRPSDCQYKDALPIETYTTRMSETILLPYKSFSNLQCPIDLDCFPFDIVLEVCYLRRFLSAANALTNVCGIDSWLPYPAWYFMHGQGIKSILSLSDASLDGQCLGEIVQERWRSAISSGTFILTRMDKSALRSTMSCASIVYLIFIMDSDTVADIIKNKLPCLELLELSYAQDSEC